ncbi:hypothetical protein Hanom_Chr15g01411961 [Helianthus anomalus]
MGDHAVHPSATTDPAVVANVDRQSGRLSRRPSSSYQNGFIIGISIIDTVY